MRNLRYIVLILLLYALPAWSQRRFSVSQKGEYSLSQHSGFSTKDVENKTDALFGLHASLYTGSHHLIGISAEGSWSAFINNMPGVRNTPGGGAAGIHLLYEYQYSGLIIQTGVGIAWQRVYTNIADTAIYHYGLTNTWGGNSRKFDLRHTFAERRDEAQNFYAQVPLYVGHYIFGSVGIGYFLAGLQFNYAFMGETKLKMVGSTAGKYYDFVGVWDEMPNHGFRKNVPLERKGDRIKLKMDVMAHVEGGYEYNTQQANKNYRTRPGDRIDCRLRFAAFVDFGILNITPDGNAPFYGIPEETLYDFPTYQAAHVFTTKDATHYWMRNLFTGIRFTVLFGFKPQERCILCDPWRH